MKSIGSTATEYDIDIRWVFLIVSVAVMVTDVATGFIWTEAPTLFAVLSSGLMVFMLLVAFRTDVPSRHPE